MHIVDRAIYPIHTVAKKLAVTDAGMAGGLVGNDIEYHVGQNAVNIE